MSHDNIHYHMITCSEQAPVRVDVPLMACVRERLAQNRATDLCYPDTRDPATW